MMCLCFQMVNSSRCNNYGNLTCGVCECNEGRYVCVIIISTSCSITGTSLRYNLSYICGCYCL